MNGSRATSEGSGKIKCQHQCMEYRKNKRCIHTEAALRSHMNGDMVALDNMTKLPNGSWVWTGKSQTARHVKRTRDTIDPSLKKPAAQPTPNKNEEKTSIFSFFSLSPSSTNEDNSSSSNSNNNSNNTSSKGRESPIVNISSLSSSSLSFVKRNNNNNTISNSNGSSLLRDNSLTTKDLKDLTPREIQIINILHELVLRDLGLPEKTKIQLIETQTLQQKRALIAQHVNFRSTSSPNTRVWIREFKDKGSSVSLKDIWNIRTALKTADNPQIEEFFQSGAANILFSALEKVARKSPRTREEIIFIKQALLCAYYLTITENGMARILDIANVAFAIALTIDFEVSASMKSLAILDQESPSTHLSSPSMKPVASSINLLESNPKESSVSLKRIGSGHKKRMRGSVTTRSNQEEENEDNFLPENEIMDDNKIENILYEINGDALELLIKISWSSEAGNKAVYDALEKVSKVVRREQGSPLLRFVSAIDEIHQLPFSPDSGKNRVTEHDIRSILFQKLWLNLKIIEFINAYIELQALVGDRVNIREELVKFGLLSRVSFMKHNVEILLQPFSTKKSDEKSTSKLKRYNSCDDNSTVEEMLQSIGEKIEIFQQRRNADITNITTSSISATAASSSTTPSALFAANRQTSHSQSSSMDKVTPSPRSSQIANPRNFDSSDSPPPPPLKPKATTSAERIAAALEVTKPQDILHRKLPDPSLKGSSPPIPPRPSADKLKELSLRRLQSKISSLSSSSSEISVLSPQHLRSDGSSLVSLIIPKSITSEQTLTMNNDDDEIEKITELFKRAKLEEYIPRFIENGYDTIERISEMDDEDFTEVVKMKTGHRKHLQRLLKSAKTQDEEKLNSDKTKSFFMVNPNQSSESSANADDTQSTQSQSTPNSLHFESVDAKELTSQTSSASNHNNRFRVIPLAALTIHEKIGSGSFGDVHRAVYQGATVAVKKVRQSNNNHDNGIEALSIAEVLREAEAMEACRHPHVVPLFGVCVAGNEVMFISEYCELGSLYQVCVESKKEFPFATVVDLAKQGVSGLVHLHACGIVHRDIAARNFLVTSHGTVKVSDFGLARIKDSASAGSAAAQTNSGVNPLKWSAPESLSNKVYSTKSDVFMCGIFFWEIFHQSEPYPGMDHFQAASKVVYERLRPTISSECTTPELAILMTACWQQLPQNRPTMSHVLAKLQDVKNTIPQQSMSSSSSSSSSSSRSLEQKSFNAIDRGFSEEPANLAQLLRKTVMDGYDLWDEEEDETKSVSDGESV